MTKSPDKSRTTPTSADTNQQPSDRWLADLALVRGVLRAESGTVQEFSRRMAVLLPFLRSRNARLGHPLSDQDVPDVAQDVLVIVWRRLDSFAGRATLESWACAIASLEMMNAVRRRRRTRARERTLAAGDLESAVSEPEAVDDFDMERIANVVQQLPEDDSEVLSLKHREDLSFPDLGRKLGLSTSGAKNRYYRILERLRRRLGSPPHESGAGQP